MITLTTPDKGKLTICIIGCLHGNEHFGRVIFDYINDHVEDFANVTVILANEPALKANKRYIDQDLNRSFPGSVTGNTEERIAYELNSKVRDFDFVLDLHTTSSPITRAVAIVPNLGEATQVIVSASPYTEIIHMESNLVAASLIGNVANAVSLELNEEYAQTHEAIEEILNIIRNLQNPHQQVKSERSIYEVLGTIPLGLKLPVSATNFKPIPEFQIIPFLIREREYTQHQGFRVEQVNTLTL